MANNVENIFSILTSISFANYTMLSLNDGLVLQLAGGICKARLKSALEKDNFAVVNATANIVSVILN